MNSTILFDLPQQEIASLITSRMSRATSISIVTGFATRGGMAAIGAPIKSQPNKLKSFVVGAATYPGFAAMDELIKAGVPQNRLYVHLGHTIATGGRKNPFARFHPMLHSKIYYMDLPDGQACAFIGSHNVTSFALTGLNGELAVMLEGLANSPEFDKIRQHIATAQNQSAMYSTDMKEAFAWWTREYLDGIRAEMKIPQGWTIVRTILLFAQAAKNDRPQVGEHIYFEIPSGIEQIESLKTETHLFLFDTLPGSPSDALEQATKADACYSCITLGVENKQGNREVQANWKIDGSMGPVLTRVTNRIHRPTTAMGLQQVRAEVQMNSIVPFDYLFENGSTEWKPIFAREGDIQQHYGMVQDEVRHEANSGTGYIQSWKLVKGLEPRHEAPREKDHLALELVSPKSGNFILVSLRRRARNQKTELLDL